jgi:hypothetical protein
MDIVSGRRSWEKQKFKQLVSTASEQGGQSKLVTKSDEALPCCFLKIALISGSQQQWQRQHRREAVQSKQANLRETIIHLEEEWTL